MGSRSSGQGFYGMFPNRGGRHDDRGERASGEVDHVAKAFS